MTQSRLDARDLICPMPVLKARKMLRDMAPGSILEILATDPAAVADFQAFCAATGHRLVSVDHGGEDVTVFRIERSG